MTADILQPELFRVTKRVEETKDAFTIEVAPLEQKSLAFSPGQFNMLYAFGIGEVPISHSGDPMDERAYAHTIKSVGSVTQALGRLNIGDLIGVRGPFGSGWPVQSLRGKNLVLITGGIGLAPLRPLISHILSRRGDFGKVTLLHGARDPEDILFADQLGLWKKGIDEVHLTVDFAETSWEGNVGVVTTLIPRIERELKQSYALLCGPEVMMRFTLRELLARGMEGKKIYLSMERNMKCAIGHCGRCQYAANFICKDGPVLPYGTVKPFFEKKEV